MSKSDDDKTKHTWYIYIYICLIIKLRYLIHNSMNSNPTGDDVSVVWFPVVGVCNMVWMCRHSIKVSNIFQWVSGLSVPMIPQYLVSDRYQRIRWTIHQWMCSGQDMKWEQSAIAAKVFMRVSLRYKTLSTDWTHDTYCVSDIHILYFRWSDWSHNLCQSYIRSVLGRLRRDINDKRVLFHFWGE